MVKSEDELRAELEELDIAMGMGDIPSVPAGYEAPAPAPAPVPPRPRHPAGVGWTETAQGLPR